MGQCKIDRVLMFKDKRKGQNVAIEEEWIEMEDLQAPKNQAISRKLAQMEGKQYVQPRPQSQNIQPPGPSPPHTINKHQASSNSSSSPQKHTSPQKLNKTSSHPSLPMMEVTCDFCTVAQRVPGNTQLYCCGSCENMNESYPLYGVAVCGCCQSSIGFGFGMSEHIRCPKCSSVNRVPLEPVKKYQSISVLGTQGIPELVGKRQDYGRQVEREDGRRFAESEDYEYVDLERGARWKQ